MTYREQLNRPEWAAKRQEILQRDGHKCTSCRAEKSEYDGWNIIFKNADFDELAQYGYCVVLNENSDYNHIMLFGKRVGEFIPFLSKIREPFSIKNVRFSAREWRNSIPHLVSYYYGDSDSARLGQLNIHHRFYISGNLAWQYENDALVTLCYDCHKVVHQNQQIEIKAADLNTAKSRYAKNCVKCEGTGYLPEFSHVYKGICFPCDGRGVL